MGDASVRVELDSSVSPIGSGREVVTCLAVSFAHPHLFIALADGHCMRWSFAASCDASSTITVENTADLVFTKCSDVRMGHIHSMHASPYGSSLIMTRSAQPPTHTTFLRLPKAIYIHRCNTDTVIFPVAVAAQTAFFIIPWNGSAALELYQTCSRTSTYWRDSLLAIWSLICQTSLSLEQSFRGLQARPPEHDALHRLPRTAQLTLLFFFFFSSDHVRAAHRLPSHSLPLRRSPHVHPKVRPSLLSLYTTRTRSLRSYTRHSSLSLSLSPPLSVLYLRALATAGSAHAISHVRSSRLVPSCLFCMSLNPHLSCSCTATSCSSPPACLQSS